MSATPTVGFSQRYKEHINAKKSALQIPDARAVICVALSTIIMAYSGWISLFPILVFYGLWFPYVLYKGKLIVAPTRETWLTMAFAAYCVLSIFWSDYSSQSLRASLEFVSMIMCVVIITRVTCANTFIKGLIIGAVITLVMTLINGRYAVDYFSGDMSLVGLFGSKNQVGFMAEIAIVSAFSFLISKKKFKKSAWLFFLISIVFSFYCLLLSRSATSQASLVLVGLVCFSAYFLSRMSRSTCRSILIVIIVAVVIMIVVGFYAQWDKAVLALFGKDATLTGRTFLWAEGIKQGVQTPILGGGYSAFWVKGQPKAEQLWSLFLINGRSGFHFHNMFVQTFVDLGAIGVLMVLILVLQAFLKSFFFALREGMTLTSTFCLGMASMFLVRSLTEVDYLGPFGIGPMLFYSILPRLAAQKISAKEAK